jgi:hypothetical protein
MDFNSWKQTNSKEIRYNYKFILIKKSNNATQREKYEQKYGRAM